MTCLPMEIFLIALLCFELVASISQLPDPKKFRLQQPACRVIKKQGFNPQSPIHLLKGVLLIDCISACRQRIDCSSGSYVKDVARRQSYCFLASHTVASDKILHTVADAVYFEFDCPKNEKIGKSRISINHGTNSNVCGRPKDFQSRLEIYKRKPLSSNQVQPYTVPWLGQVIRGQHQTCGITLIAGDGASRESTMWAVSAAHCFNMAAKVGDTSKVDIRAFSFMFGAYDLRYPTPHIVVRRAQNIVVHPRYDFLDDNDIAMVKFDRKILFNDFVRPICLPSTDLKIPALQSCLSCGYGRNQGGPAVPSCFRRDLTLWREGISPVTKVLDRFKSGSEDDASGLLECTQEQGSSKIGVPHSSKSGLIGQEADYGQNPHATWINKIISSVDPVETSKRAVKRESFSRPCWGSFAKSCTRI